MAEADVRAEIQLEARRELVAEGNLRPAVGAVRGVVIIFLDSQ